MFDGLFKAVASVVTVPVSVVADTVTLGGALTERDTPYTVEAVEDLFQNIMNLGK